MYEKFYGLKRPPFSLLPDPEFLYPARKHAMALTLLKYSLMSKHSITVITGEVGSGKTTLLNRLLDEVSEHYTVGMINFTERHMSQLWPWVMQSFDLPFENRGATAMYDDFVRFIEGEASEHRTTVLIVDEAQNLGPKALESLRMMSNVNSRSTMLQLVLVGQPEFRETLKRKDLRQLNQRVATFYSLEPFTLAETVGYIDHRMQVAGGRSGTFTAGAAYLIWRASEGIPRRINTLCDLALVYGYSSAQETINVPLAAEMLAERQDLAVQTAADAQDEPHWDEEREQDNLRGLDEHDDDASRASLKVIGHSPRHSRE